jgi:protein-disulfide isomerase
LPRYITIKLIKYLSICLKKGIVMVRKQTLILGLLASIGTLSAAYSVAETGSGHKDASSSFRKEDGGKQGGSVQNTSHKEDSSSTEKSKEGVSLVGATSASSSNNVFSEAQIKDIKLMIGSTLKENPEMIVEALQKFTDRQQQEQFKKMQDGLSKNRDRIIDPSSATLLGNSDAETKLVVFLDPNCPHCRRFEQAIDKVKSQYPKVAILMRYWPILGPDSEKIASALWAIKGFGPGKFEEFARIISSKEGPFTYEMFVKLVEEHKLDKGKFEAAVNSAETKTAIGKTDSLARELGLQGTPTSLLVNKEGVRLVMPTDEKSLEIILKGELKGESKSS